jgi:type II secretory pathway component PulF
MATFSWPTLDISRTLSSEDAMELATRVAELTKAGLPLGAGLRALAGELPGQRLPHVLQNLADRLDAGDDLAAAIDSLRWQLPPHLRGLILAGLRTGQLPEVLEEYVDLERSQSDLRRRLWSSLLYPFVLMAVLTAMTVFARVYFISGFESIFRSFNTKLPLMTEWFILYSWPAMWGMVVLMCVAAFVPMLLAAAQGMSWLWPALYKIPMIGPVLRWGHLSQFGRLMGLLTEQRVPLPDALRLTSDGLCDASLASACCGVADEVSNGRVLYESMAARWQFPASMIPLIEWGQRAPALSDAFRAIAEMFEGRVRTQSSLFKAILLPVMFLVIVTFVGMFVLALMLPMVSLIQKLS